MRHFQACRFVLMLAALCALAATLSAQNEILGEVQLEGISNVEKSSGVWVDGQYVGYLNELKGSKKILLLPGEHQITVKQAGYLDFNRKVVLQPKERQVVRVTMQKDTRVQMPTTTAEVKLSVNPTRAAVFVDGVMVGHVGEFSGVGKAMLVGPGKHKFVISLPGYASFETEVNLAPNQKFEIKTDLLKGGTPGETEQ
jgi:hypothetical protein